MTSSFDFAVDARHWSQTAPLAQVAPARFIPREEIGAYAAWSPSALGKQAPVGDPQPKAAEPAPAAPAPDPMVAIDAARQASYQDGYRDGLAALEDFRQNHAKQVSAQLGSLLGSFGEQLDSLQAQMAEVLAKTARDLARQVVRHELAVQPELVGSVAHEAVTSLLLSARHVTLRVHPDDRDLVMQGLGDELDRRGARLIDDASISRGGCLVESDVGLVDARIENRWSRASAALAEPQDWHAA